MLGFGRWCTVVGDVQLVVLASTVRFHMFLFFCQVASPDMCMAALLRIYAFRHTCVMT